MRKRLNSLIYFGLAAGATAVLVACGQPSQIQTSNNAPTVEYKSRLKIESLDEIASFSITSGDDNNFLNVFISPSCNFCERLTLQTLEAIDNNDPDFFNTNINFTLMPRKPLDVRIIAGLMCIEAPRRPRAVIDYYRLVQEKNGTRAIYDETALAAYTKIMSQYGISGSKLATCENDEFSRKKIADVYVVGSSVRTKNAVPVVLYNDEYLGTLHFDDMKRVMRNR